MNARQTFIFDYGRCVGCAACVVACAVENELPPAHTWRALHYFEFSDPFHLSLACNHCDDAPCVRQCPARALSKDGSTGLVQVNAAHCIGCRYCSWVCPYDAPKFEPGSGVMSKCSGCAHRLAEDLAPACVSICPVDALQMEARVPAPQTPELPGLPPKVARPALEVIKKTPLPNLPLLPFDEAQTEAFLKTQNGLDSKISLRQEWPLLLFTLSLAGGVALFAALFGGKVDWNWRFGLLLPALSVLISLRHLGKPLRAWRAGLNVFRSWLSREVVFTGMFLAAALAAFYRPQQPLLVALAAGSGLLALCSADMLYRVTARQVRWYAHSAELWAICCSLFALFYGFDLLLAGVLLVRAVLYARRKHSFKQKWLRIGWPLLRLVLLAGAGLAAFYGMLVPALFLLVTGDVLDRIEFYRELEIIAPAWHMQQVLPKFVNSTSVKVVSKVL